MDAMIKIPSSEFNEEIYQCGLCVVERGRAGLLTDRPAV